MVELLLIARDSRVCVVWCFASERYVHKTFHNFEATTFIQFPNFHGPEQQIKNRLKRNATMINNTTATTHPPVATLGVVVEG